MFEKLTFASPREKEDFEKYKKLKGVYLHKQVYDILLEANGGKVTYHELSSIIRYDKNLRDTLYIYLATAEEYLRALLCEKYDVAAECKPFEHHCYKPLMEALHDKDDESAFVDVAAAVFRLVDHTAFDRYAAQMAEKELRWKIISERFINCSSKDNI